MLVKQGKKRYHVYARICYNTEDILYGKCTSKAGADGCCKHVAASLYQLVDFFDSGTKEVPDDKTCTDLLQK